MLFKIRFDSYTITGLLGRDEKLYWILNDIATLMGYKRVNYLSRVLHRPLKVFNIVDHWEQYPEHYKFNVLPHDQMIEIFNSGKCYVHYPAFVFHAKLEDMQTRVKEVEKGVLEFCDDVDAMQFSVWLAWIKLNRFYPNFSEDHDSFMSHFHDLMDYKQLHLTY